MEIERSLLVSVFMMGVMLGAAIAAPICLAWFYRKGRGLTEDFTKLVDEAYKQGKSEAVIAVDEAKKETRREAADAIYNLVETVDPTFFDE